MNRGPAAEIDLSALQHNLRIIRGIVGARPLIAVVKADAYGHGAIEVSHTLVSEGVTTLAVAYTGEAKLLRDSGIRSTILVLFDRSDIDDYFTHDLTPVIQDLKTADAFSREAVKRGKKIRVHVKIDTGMGRIGLHPESAVSDLTKIFAMQGVEISGLMSHFSEADLSDRSYAVQQLKTFQEIRNAVSSLAGDRIISHMANSAAVLSFRDALLDAVRPGLDLYGCAPFNDSFGLTPVMRIKTRVLVVRDLEQGAPVSYGRTYITGRKSKIAVLPVGYADGYSRLFSNNAEVLIRGRRVPVVGRVCMDVSMADVTDVSGVCEGDEAVIMGRQGNETISASELAARIDTIPYDIMTSLGARARKEYIH